MNKLRMKKGIAILCIIIMSLISVMSVSADTQSNTKEIVSTPFQKVNIGSKSYFQITDMSLLPTNEGKLITYRVDLYNGSTTDLNLIDYWSRIRTTDGTKFVANLISADEKKEIVTPGSNVSYTFYAKVNSNIELKDIYIDFVEWDFSYSNYEKSLGSVRVPADYSFNVPFQTSKILQINNSPVSTKVLGMSYTNNSLDNVEINLEYTNEGRQGVAIPDYQYFIRTEEGFLYPLNESKTEMKLQPKVSGELELTTTVPDNVSKENWQLILTNFENKSGGINVPIGFFDLEVVEKEEVIVPVYGDYVMDEADYQVSTKISKVTYVGNEVTIYYEITNNNSVQVSIPAFGYTIQSNQNQTYPLNIVSGQGELKLNPNASKEIQLSVSLPITVDKNQLKLNVTNNDSKDNQIVYMVPQESNESTTNEYRYTNSSGVYGIKLDKIQRLPNNEQDIVSANVVISNKSSNVLPIIDLMGSFILDGVRFENNVVDLIKNDKVLNLQPYSEMNYTFYVSIPYTYQFDKVQLLIQEQLEDQSKKNVTQFNKSSEEYDMGLVKKTESLKINEIGQRATLSILDVRTFKGANTNVYYVLAEMVNDERRYTNLKELAAYFKTEDDLYFPAEVTNMTEKVMPNGKVQVGIWSKMPKVGIYNYNNLEFILGEQIPSTSGALTNAVKFELPKELQEKAGSTDKMQLNPYTLSMKNIKGTKVSVGSVLNYDLQIMFDYTVEKAYYDSYSNNHSLVYEIVIDGNVIDSRSFEFDKDLVVGSDKKEIIIGQLDEETKKTLEKVNEFTLNIYQQFDNNHRKHIATKQLEWNWIVN